MSNGKMSAKAIAKNALSKSMELRDLNDEQGQAALTVKGKGRVSEQAIEVLAASPAAKDAIETEVLYQRLGNNWYAFTQVNDEVFYSKVSEAQVTQARMQATGVDRVAAILAERSGKASTEAQTQAEIDALFHQPSTRTGNRTRNGGGNA